MQTLKKYSVVWGFKRFYKPVKAFIYLAFGLFLTIPAYAKIDRIVGSSTLFPVLAAVSDHFYFQHLGIPPLIEPTGTGGGITLFCSKSTQAPVLVAASRPMSLTEKAYCKREGIDVLEIDLGLDGIVMVHARTRKTFDINVVNLRQALEESDTCPKLWSDIDPAYPSTPIKVLGPPSTAGTYDALTHLLSLKKFRRDGGFRTASDQETILVQKLIIERDAYGIVSFGFIQKNKKLVFPCSVQGVLPTSTAIADGSYALSRRLYLYANKAKLKNAPFVRAFLDFLVSPYVTDSQGLFEQFGLIAHPPSHYKALQKSWRHFS